ncbi:hypothetical protein [Corynebacterium gerontici]|uniref:hypothetical protein n=1 Tax=Corynebacterium gerontici TaxID=2079234 RepID=UPI000F5085D1|nr:hypothetical protein [Corynebacterium gerontici]
MERTDRARFLIAIASLLALIVLLGFLGSRSAGSSHPLHNGDVLGQEREESFGEYQRRANATLEGEAERFALVTFRNSLDPRAASDALRTVRRVNAIVVNGFAPLAIPEPTGEEDRADVITRYQRIAQFPEAPLDSVVVFERSGTLRELSENPKIVAVEALPDGAAWGHFGIKPVRVGAV